MRHDSRRAGVRQRRPTGALSAAGRGRRYASLDHAAWRPVLFTRLGRTCSTAIRFSSLDRVKSVGSGGFPTHRPDRDTDRGTPALPVVVPRRRSAPPCHPGLVPLLSGLIPAGGARGLSTSGFPTLRASRDTDFGSSASTVAVTGDAPVSPVVTLPRRHGRTRSGHPRPSAGPAFPVMPRCRNAWMPGTSPGMTRGERGGTAATRHRRIGAQAAHAIL